MAQTEIYFSSNIHTDIQDGYSLVCHMQCILKPWYVFCLPPLYGSQMVCPLCYSCRENRISDNLARHVVRLAEIPSFWHTLTLLVFANLIRSLSCFIRGLHDFLTTPVYIGRYFCTLLVFILNVIVILSPNHKFSCTHEQNACMGSSQLS